MYLRALRRLRPPAVIKIVPGKYGSSPLQVLSRMKTYLRKNKPDRHDEAWLVVDRDQWPEPHIRQLQDWTREDSARHLAVSNPCFEYWLLLHFEDYDVKDSRACKARLQRHIPNYDKHIDDKMVRCQWKCASARAKMREKPSSQDWPRDRGTTFYRLVESVFK